MKSFLILGLGVFGRSIAKTLYEQGHDVLVADRDKDLIQEMAEHSTHGVIIDAIDEEAIKQLGVNNFDVAIVAIGADIQASILATLILKELGVKHIVAKAINELHGKLLNKVGADRIVYPEREMGERIAKSLSSQNILDYIDISDDYSIVEIAAPKDIVGKTLIELNIRAKYGITVMAVKKDDARDLRLFPRAEYVIQKSDVLILVGSKKSLQKYMNKKLD